MTVSTPKKVPPAAAATLLELSLLAVSAHIERAETQRDQPDVRIRYNSHLFDDNELHFLLRYGVAAGVDEATEVHLDATYSVMFAMHGEFDAAAEATEKFVSHTVAMAVHPYLRELLASTCARMNAEPPPLPLLRPGEFIFDTGTEPNEPDQR